MKVKVDSRIGSKQYYAPLTKLFNGKHKVELTTLPFGDFAWTSTDENDSPITCAAELVKIPDLLAKIETRRFTDHQLPGLLQRNRVVYLIVEGRWLVKPDGSLDIFAGEAGPKGWKPKKWRSSGFLYRSVVGFLNSMACFPGVIVVRTNDDTETAHWLAEQVNWWSKPWSDHSSFQAWAGVTVLGSVLTMSAPSNLLKVAAQIPQLGQEKAPVVAKHFKTIRKMVNASAEDWVGLRPAGKTKAGKMRPGITLKGALEIQKIFDEEHKS